MSNIYKINRKILTSRDIVKKYKKIIDNIHNDVVVLDFSNVDFISRSTAHEFLKLKEYYKVKKSKYLEIQNINEDISKMFEIVAKSMVIRKKQPELKIVTKEVFA